MTQTLIEKLEALPRWWALVDGKSKLVLDAYAVGEIIKQAKAEKQEPVGAICDVTKSGLSYAAFTKTLPIGTMLYTTPQPDIVAELVKALEDARDDVLECLNHDLPNKGWERYDRRIELREKQIKTIEALLAKTKEMMG